jgi:hypothetical protein
MIITDPDFFRPGSRGPKSTGSRDGILGRHVEVSGHKLESSQNRVFV